MIILLKLTQCFRILLVKQIGKKVYIYNLLDKCDFKNTGTYFLKSSNHQPVKFKIKSTVLNIDAKVMQKHYLKL